MWIAMSQPRDFVVTFEFRTSFRLFDGYWFHQTAFVTKEGSLLLNYPAISDLRELLERMGQQSTVAHHMMPEEALPKREQGQKSLIPLKNGGLLVTSNGKYDPEEFAKADGLQKSLTEWLEQFPSQRRDGKEWYDVPLKPD